MTRRARSGSGASAPRGSPLGASQDGEGVAAANDDAPSLGRPAAGESVQAVLVSQNNCWAVLGLTPRAFLDSLPALGLRALVQGKARLVRVGDYIAAVERRNGLAANNGTEEDEREKVRASLGVRRRK